MGFTFQTTPSLLVEAGGSAKIGEIFSKLGCRSVLVGTDPGIVEAGRITPALAGLAAAGIRHASPPRPGAWGRRRARPAARRAQTACWA